MLAGKIDDDLNITIPTQLLKSAISISDRKLVNPMPISLYH